MTLAQLVQRSLAHYWRTNLGVVLGAALGTMVLTGSLMVGDSVQDILRRQGEERVGKIQSALVAGDRTFRAALAGEIGQGTVPVLMLRGSVGRADTKARVNQAQVLGVTPAFTTLALKGHPLTCPEGAAWLNETLARQLGAKKGETVIVRVEKPTAFSRDAPLSGEENDTVALRVTVQGILSAEELGHFSLQANPVPVPSLFLPLAWLQSRLGVKDGANLLLSEQLSAPALAAAAREHWKPADAGLEQRLVPPRAQAFDKTEAVQLAQAGKVQELEIRSPRVFLDDSVVAGSPYLHPALTYLVNEIRAGEKATPYSMATAVDWPFPKLQAHEAALSQWEADDLGVGTGAKITLKYFIMGERRKLEERSSEFTVREIIPMNRPGFDSTWMPDFPGLSDKENCRDWNPGFALDNSRIRDKDEAYWKQYRGTPKVIIGLAEGQALWGNRWGEVTSLRTLATPEAAGLLHGYAPAQLGMTFLPLHEQAMAATHPPFGFGELFIAFSFFLLAAAAVLTGLLFVFAMEQRNEEAGLLLALGWTPRQVRWRFLREGAVLAARGSFFGVLAALVYTPLVLLALTTVWRGAAQGIGFHYRPHWGTLVIGAASGLALALAAMWLASRRQLRRTAADLLTSTGGVESAAVRGGRPWSFYIGLACLLATAAMLLSGAAKSPAGFFSAGSLLLIAGICFSLYVLRLRASRPVSEQLTVGRLGARNAARRRGRSVATIAVLASGVFMVVAVDAFRQRQESAPGARKSGSGGFALLGESSLPIYEDLNTTAGRETYALDEKTLAGASVVPLRVKEGDDASCLNLNRAVQPRLMAVKPYDLSRLGAFRFAEKGASWQLLERSGNDTMPGIVDAKTLEWALQKGIGDTVEYQDERGAPLHVKLVASVEGSVLQGSVIIGEPDFIAHFPSSGGYRYFLIDAPADRAAAIGQEFSRALTDRGLEITPTARRLANFQAVENTYLSIFQALGGLGLLLGSVGLAIVVGRNVLERRREFALLEAVGFRTAQLRQMVFAEHRWLIVSGLVIGTGSAVLGVWPSLHERAGGFPLRGLAWLLAALTLGALFWTWLATRLALRREQLSALRSE